MKSLLYTLCLVYIGYIDGISIVYNMRIAAVTKRQQIEGSVQHPHLMITTPFMQWRTLHKIDKTKNVGDLLSYIYTRENYYVKLDAAVAHVHNNINNQVFKTTQTDDLLLTGGYGHKVGKKLRMAYSGLFGIPTHKDTTLDLATFGINHIGMGIQIDSAYQHNDNHVTFLAARTIYFFDREVTVTDARLCALYPLRQYNFDFGNLIDLLCSHQIRWHTVNRLEFGYDATFLIGSKIRPAIATATFPNTLRVARNSFFAAYLRPIIIKSVPMGIILAVSYGFDSKPKIIGDNHFITLWGSWGIAF